MGIVDDLPPQSTFWVLQDQKEVIGKFIIRHELTPRLREIGGHFGGELRPSFRSMGIASRALALGLEKMRQLGLTAVFATCDFDNKNAIQVMEKNQGQFEKAYRVANWPKEIHRYNFNL